MTKVELEVRTLDELREEGPLDVATERGPGADDMCGDNIAAIAGIKGSPKKAPLGPPLSHTSDNFIPVPKPHKGQQQQMAEEGKRPGTTGPHKPHTGPQPLPRGSQQPVGHHDPWGPPAAVVGPLQHQTAAKPNTPESHGEVVTAPSVDETRTGAPCERLLASAPHLAAGTGGIGAAEVSPPLAMIEAWGHTSTGVNGPWERPELTIAEGARVLLEAYVLYRYDTQKGS